LDFKIDKYAGDLIQREIISHTNCFFAIVLFSAASLATAQEQSGSAKPVGKRDQTIRRPCEYQISDS
jgi:hypothetical protein